MYLSLASVEVDIEFERDGELMIEFPDENINTVDDFKRLFSHRFTDRLSETRYGRIEDTESKVSATIRYETAAKIRGNEISVEFSILMNQTDSIEHGMKNSHDQTRLIERAAKIVIDSIVGKPKPKANMSADVSWIPLYQCLKHGHINSMDPGYSSREFVAKINCLEQLFSARIVDDILPGSYLPKWSKLSKTRDIMGLPTDMYELLKTIVHAPIEESTHPYMRTIRLPIDNSSSYVDTIAKIFHSKNVLVSPNVYRLNTERLNGDNSDVYEALSLLQGQIVEIDIAPIAKHANASNFDLMMIRGNQIRLMIEDHPSILFIIRDGLETTTVPQNVADVAPNRRDSVALDILLRALLGNLHGVIDLKSYNVHINDMRRCVKSACMEIGRPEYTDRITRNLKDYKKKWDCEFTSTDEIYAYTKLFVGYEENHVSRAYWNPTDKGIMDNVNPGYLIEENPGTPLKKEEPIVNIKKKNALAPMEQLDRLIGLQDVKDIVRKLIAHYQFIGEHDEINTSAISNHMIFTGNPGTAKTTTARIMYDILVKAGRLKPNRFVEVGRQDLVAQYVGQTAPKVKDAFDRAIGGMLFIDEAYSLSIKEAGGFGEEAVATLVQEMENHRNDIIVILAGYKDEMEQMIHINPGLRSRISFTIDFPDYNADELVDITCSIASDMGYIIGSDAVEFIRKKFSEEKLPVDLGNGRYARNLIEHAIINHSLRMMEGYTGTCYTLLNTQDLESAWKEVYKPGKSRRTGF